MTTSIIFPRVHASDALLSTGPGAGATTKLDPGTLAAQGLVPGQPTGARILNFNLNAYSLAARRALTVAALRLHPLSQAGVSVTDTAESMAAVSRGFGYPAILVKTAQAFGAGDSSRVQALGVPASITSLMLDAANSTPGGRLVVCGTGGNRISYSDDFGATWTAGGTLGNTPQGALIYDTTRSKFLVGKASVVSTSTDATAWTSPSSQGIDLLTGIALLTNGRLIVGKDLSNGVCRTSTDAAATTWADAGTVANAGSLDDGGFYVGCGDTAIHAGRLSSGATLQISTSTDGTTWATTNTFAHPAGPATYASRPRVLCCKQTGLVVYAAPLTGGMTELRASFDKGTTWTGAVYAPDFPTAAFGIANGQLFATRDAELFASVGIGAE